MRTELTLETLKRELERNCGDIMLACKAAGVSRAFVEQWRKDDPEVNTALAEAQRFGTDMLVSAAIQRGVHGVEEDVYYKGEVVGQKVNYSDTLLGKLLTAKIPEFSKDGEGGTSVTVNIANLMPRANNYEEWLAMKQQTLAPPPVLLPDPVEGEYAEVEPLPFGGIEL